MSCTKFLWWCTDPRELSVYPFQPVSTYTLTKCEFDIFWSKQLSWSCVYMTSRVTQMKCSSFLDSICCGERCRCSNLSDIDTDSTFIPLVQHMILPHGVLVQWIRFFMWHAPCPVGSKNRDLSVHTHLCGLLKKRKSRSDWRLFRRLLWRHPSDHLARFLEL